MANKIVIVPDTGLEVANLPFGIIAGEGKDNYEGTDKEYTVCINLTKKSAKILKEEILDFWEENKGQSKLDKPKFFETMIKTREDGSRYVYVTSKTKYDGKPMSIKIVDGKRNPLDPDKYGSFGGTTTGRVAVSLAIFSDGKNIPQGVGRYIGSVQLTSFSSLGGNDGSDAFGEEDGDDLSGHNFETEKPKKNGKKK